MPDSSTETNSGPTSLSAEDMTKFWGADIMASEHDSSNQLPLPGRLAQPGIFADFMDRLELRKQLARQEAAERLGKLIKFTN